MKKVNTYLSPNFCPLNITAAGVIFTGELKDRLYEVEEWFREKIILKINEIAGNGWNVKFTQVPSKTEEYLVDITVTNADLYQPVITLINESFPEFSFIYFRPGLLTPIAMRTIQPSLA